ncbi:MAG: hypothetical protein MZW92_68255 [Comamonadaceae bacterium]|nr:hypothetical protein [Comamonadaceae bacterium]
MAARYVLVALGVVGGPDSGRFAAGLMMGVGGALDPRWQRHLDPGCDTDAVAVGLGDLLRLLAGVAAGLLLMRAVRGSLPPVACAADRPASRPSPVSRRSSRSR